MNSHVIQFDASGNGFCLWTDAIPLRELGTLGSVRASTVEFNAARQCWEVRLASDPGNVAYSHTSRTACLVWERRILNETLCSQTQ